MVGRHATSAADSEHAARANQILLVNLLNLIIVSPRDHPARLVDTESAACMVTEAAAAQCVRKAEVPHAVTEQII
jgi:hypothetical protein